VSAIGRYFGPFPILEGQETGRLHEKGGVRPDSGGSVAYDLGDEGTAYLLPPAAVLGDMVIRR
jgi:hypothetical protein